MCIVTPLFFQSKFSSRICSIRLICLVLEFITRLLHAINRSLFDSISLINTIFPLSSLVISFGFFDRFEARFLIRACREGRLIHHSNFFFLEDVFPRSLSRARSSWNVVTSVEGNESLLLSRLIEIQ